MARIVNVSTYRNGKYKDEDNYGKEYIFGDVLRIGRGRFVEAKIESHYVSECHCFIINYKDRHYLGDCSTYGTWYPISKGKNFVTGEKDKKLENIIKAENLSEVLGIIGMDLNELMKNVEGEGIVLREARKLLFQGLNDLGVKEKLVESGKVKPLSDESVFGIFPCYEFQFVKN